MRGHWLSVLLCNIILSYTANAQKAGIPSAAIELARQVAKGAAQGAVEAATAPAQSGDPSFSNDPKAAAAALAKKAAMGAAAGALNSAGVTAVNVDPSTGAVSVDQIKAKSSKSLALYSTMVSVAAGSLNLTDTQKAVLLAYTATAITTLNSSIELNCAWQASVGLNFNVAFPDGYAIYHVLYVPKLEGPFDVVRIEGEYPYVRYFSFQSYDPSTLDPIRSVRDYAITPLSGVNPFATPASDIKARGKYQVHVTLNGKLGYPNELPTITPGSNATGAFVLLRLYAYDVKSPNKTSIWGAVPPPLVKYKIYNPNMNEGGVWYTIDQCTDKNSQVAAEFVNAVSLGVSRATASEDSTSSSPCPTYNSRDNFRLFRRVGSRAPFVNADANYLLSCGSMDGVKGDLVAVVTGVLPPAPAGLWTPPYVADYMKYNARYVSMSAYDLNLPGPVLHTLFDYDIVQFYSKYWGSESLWGARAKRQYKMVMAADPSIARRCGHLTDDAMYLSSWGQNAEVKYPGLVLREILSQSNRNGASPNNTQSIYNVKLGCEADTEKCGTAAYASSIMGSYYPKVVYYNCLTSGKALAAPYNASVSY